MHRVEGKHAGLGFVLSIVSRKCHFPSMTVACASGLGNPGHFLGMQHSLQPAPLLIRSYSFPISQLFSQDQSIVSWSALYSLCFWFFLCFHFVLLACRCQAGVTMLKGARKADITVLTSVRTGCSREVVLAWLPGGMVAWKHSSPAARQPGSTTAWQHGGTAARASPAQEQAVSHCNRRGEEAAKR